MPQLPTAQHEPAAQRFAIHFDDGTTAELAYSTDGRVLDLLHTYVPDRDRGQGVGAALVRAALAYARAHALRVIATCSFAHAWLEAHPGERGDLAAARG